MATRYYVLELRAMGSDPVILGISIPQADWEATSLSVKIVMKA
jgi:hypothetical protein